jgi:hypothetical protein
MAFSPKQPSSMAGISQFIEFDASRPIQNCFGPETWQIRLVSSAPCFYCIGDGEQTATMDDIFLPANVIEYVMVNPGQRISARRAALESPGTLYVTEMH